jgi:hypothetical protein
VLLEILIKLCDIRDNDTCLEPEINFSAATAQSYKKKGNGLRRLKGPDVGTEEWGNLSDDLGNGSGSGSEEDVYSSSDESLPGNRLLNCVVQCSAVRCSAVLCRLIIWIRLLCPVQCA